jgi:tRNA (guanine-N7-)-methyltransferase
MNNIEIIDFKRPQINKTSALKIPNYYTVALNEEFAEFAFNEERAPLNKGNWRTLFGVSDEAPMDLEIGTGNGVHFQHFVLNNPNRCLLGLELKYKPLIQTIRGALRKGAKNGRVARVHAFNIDHMFEAGELNDVYIHFPDPWTSPRKPKNRMVNPRMLDLLWNLQRPESFIEFKTDSREMFLWSLEHIKKSKYKIEFQTLNLHDSEIAQKNVITGFEKIFIRQGIEINYVKIVKP